MTESADTDTRYNFTEAHDHWSKPFRENARRHLWPLRTTPIAYLEIGVHEGRSLVWMANQILRHEGSIAVGVDLWADDTKYSQAKSNLRHHEDQVGLIRGTLTECASTFEQEYFDVIYIDGDHTYLPVLTDTVVAWPLLKSGGIMIWDDTDWPEPEYQVRRAIESALPHLPHTVMNADKQTWVRKTASL